MSLVQKFAVLALCACSAFAQRDPIPFPRSSGDDPTAVLPKIISRVEPTCPADVLRPGAGSDVYVAFVVDKTGQPVLVRAFFSEHPALEPAAEAAVREWRFTPRRARRKDLPHTHDRRGAFSSCASFAVTKAHADRTAVGWLAVDPSRSRRNRT